jgi:hypothetical protein
MPGGPRRLGSSCLDLSLAEYHRSLHMSDLVVVVVAVLPMVGALRAGGVVLDFLVVE